MLNWTDARAREQIDRCREWVESFNPPKQLVLETKFGVIDSQLLDIKFMATRFPLFGEAHPIPNEVEASSSSEQKTEALEVHELLHRSSAGDGSSRQFSLDQKPEPRRPLRFPNQGTDFRGCGWIFHVDDVFNRDKLFELLGAIRGLVRLKGVFRCETDWWVINRSKEATDFSKSTYRRDSRLEIIFESDLLSWDYLEENMMLCLKS